MNGPNVRLQECVVKLHDDREECIFCGHTYGKGTSITRIGYHLSGVKGKGVKPCVGNVPEEIKEAALGRNVSSSTRPGEDVVGQFADQSCEAILFGENRGDPFPTSSTMLVGQAFEENARQIRSWIMDDEVSTIGIYGMAGVGKTELLKYIHNELLQSQDSTHRLYWVHVSQKFSIKSLQNLIATLVGLDLSSEDDDQSRATKLSKELRLNQGWILFLDDLCDDFELDAVGIPETIKGCKLIVSTRSEYVCRKVASRSMRVNLLSHEEAVSLFMMKLGPDIELSSEKRRIADCIVNKCRGLPLEIIAMARSMKRLSYDHQWRDVLQDLEQSSAGHSDMEKMEGVSPSFMDDDVNQLDVQAQEDNFNMSELPSSFNQSSMLCNYQAGQKTLVDNDVINDSIQQTMMEGAPPSFVDDNVSLTLNQLDFDTLMSELPPFSQTMITMGGLDGTSSSWINQNGPHWAQTPSSEQQWTNELPMSNQVPGMLPQPPMNQCSQQFPYQFNQVPIMPNPYDPQCSTMLPEPSQTLRQEEEAAARIQVSNITSSNSLHKEPLVKMNKTRDPLWEHVVQLDDDRKKCIFCGQIFAKDTPITRIRHHWSGVKRKGVRTCVGNVPEGIKEAALGRNGSSHMPPGEDLASGLTDQRLEDTASLSDETRGDPFPISSTMLVGRAFEENTKKIWSWIMDDKVSTIGIYGMAGVGKTELLKHVHNDLLQSQNSTHRLYWVHVSQNSSNENSSIERLQNLIAKRIGLDLSSEDDDQSRAIKLSKKLLRLNQRWILFLDDLWDDCLNDFELDVVGIPETIKGCKLIASTRSQDVCRTVANRCIIEVDTLSNEEAMSLFMKKLGHNIENYPEKRRIAECVVNKCGGLPLAIKAMARFMRRFRFDRQWREALKYMEESSAGQSHMKRVFRTLKSSYTHLKKYDQKEGFLYCALFPKAFMIPRDDLIAYLIDEGVIAKQESREAEFRRGHVLLDRLEDACLLESIDGGSAVKMHDLIRNVAIEIYQERGRVIIKAGENLKNLSGAREWEESLLTASLIENQIKEIPSTDSPKCPELSTLLLPYNRELELIDDTFFNQLHGLKILDLSHTVIVKLPNSVSNLVGLTALLLIDCKKLVHVPSLEKLGEMRRLDLYRTALENIPQGLECLCELRYLRIRNCGQKKFPGWVLRKLSHLQVFILGWGKNAPMTVKGEEVGCLKKLEDLECHFKGHSDLVKFFNYRDQTHSLKTYKVRVGHLKEKNGKFSCLKEFYCSGCKSTKKLLPLVFLENLEVIEVSECEKMVEIIETESDEGLIDEESSRSSSTTKLKLPKLKTLKLIELPELKSIFSATLICDSLEVIHIKNCEKLKRIPIFLPFLESNQSSPHPSLEIIIHPEERWESALEWDHPNAKDALRRFVKFQ